MSIYRVLVVDDDETARTSLVSLLQERGYEVLTATSGQESLVLAGKMKPDIIFMDIIMESMDGFQACRKLKTNEATKDIPVIMVTSKNQPVDRLWAQKQGATAYIAKPYSADDIEKELHRL